MAKYNLTNKAVQDLSDIWEYTVENWSERQADNYYQMLLKTCQEIAENPGLGKNYDGITSNLFGWLASSHIIFYRKITPNEVEITRILYGGMDLKNRITE